MFIAPVFTENFLRGLFKRGLCHFLLSLGKCAEQRAVAEQIDQPRNSPAQPEKPGEGRRGEYLVFQSGDREAVRYIRCNIFFRERTQVIACRNSLRELPQLCLFEHFTEFRLSEEDDLEELVFIGFEVRKEPQLLQDVCA